jgi:hypothetical protein
MASIASPVSALFTRRKSPYLALGLDCYDIHRDALTFSGSGPVIAHPPCRSWSKLSHFAKPRPGERELAIWAMAVVRQNGGCLEHPIDSRLWAESRCLSWGLRDDFGGVLVPIAQSAFGHPARKFTGIYMVGIQVPDVPPPLPASRSVESMCRAQREHTPLDLAIWLHELAKTSQPSGVSCG